MRFDRRTVALGLGAAGAVAAATLVTVAGKSSSETPAHRAVSSYIEQVDGVQQQLRLRLTGMLTAYRSFTTQRPSARALQDVRAAEATFAELDRRVRALHPPPEAARLHALILQLIVSDRDVAHELTELVGFTPRFRSAFAAAAAASRRLAAELARARVPRPHSVRGTPKQIAKARAAYRKTALAAAAAQASAVSEYTDRLGAVVRRLRALHPPPVMRPMLRAQVDALEATRHAGDVLAGQLRTSDLTKVPLLSRHFSLAARSAASVGAQRAEIAAIKAYNARVRRTGALTARIRNEAARVQSAVG